MNLLKYRFCAKRSFQKATSIKLVDYITLFSLLFTLITFYSCTKREAEIPSYLHVQKFNFHTDLVSQGSPSENITDGHIYVNGKYLGAFELPVTVPVLDKGNCNIVIFPGIKENGSSVNRKTIKVLQAYEIEATLTPAKIDTIKPSTSYRDNTFFAWIEDFETGNLSTEPSSKNTGKDSVQIIDSSNANAYKDAYSKYSAMIKIPASDERVFFEHFSIEKFNVPNKGADVYLEIDYKTNVNLQIGFYADKPTMYEQIPFLVLSPTEEWKKVYMNLSIETSVLEANTPIQIFYGFVKDKTDTDIAPEIYLDNLKLTYLN